MGQFHKLTPQKIRKTTTNNKSTFSGFFFKTAKLKLASFRQCVRWAFGNVWVLPIEVKYPTEKSKRSVPESQRIAEFKPLATVHHCLSWVSSIFSYLQKIFLCWYQGKPERRRQPLWRDRAKPSCGRPTPQRPTGRSQARSRTWWRQSCWWQQSSQRWHWTRPCCLTGTLWRKETCPHPLLAFLGNLASVTSALVSFYIGRDGKIDSIEK